MPSSIKKKPEPMLDITGVAEFCGVSDKTVRRWIEAGDLLAAKLGNQWRIQPRDLQDFIRERMSR